MEIILYSTGCPKCNVLKAKLNAKGFTFTEFTDTERMLEMGLASVPILSVDGALMDFAEANAWLNGQPNSADNTEGDCTICKLS